MTGRFPAPWRIVEIAHGFAVENATGKQIGVFYGRAPDVAGHTGIMTMDEARQMALDFAKLPELLLAATGTGKEILGATGVIIGLTNYAVPSAISLAPSGPVRLGACGVWGVTMTVGAIAGASFVRNSLGTSEVSRDETIKERARLQGIIAKPTEIVSDASVVDARARVETAKATARADCAPVKTKDIDQCNRSRAAVARAQDDLKLANERHDLDVKAAEQRHRLDVADAEAKPAALPATSADRNVVLAGVVAILPFASDGLVNGLVAALWVALFSFGPCTLLRLGLALLASTRNRPLAGWPK